MATDQFEPALRMASRLRSLRPADKEATAVVSRVRRIPQWEQVTVAPWDGGR